MESSTTGGVAVGASAGAETLAMPALPTASRASTEQRAKYRIFKDLALSALSNSRIGCPQQAKARNP
jgi:hypothetical protein